jgi:hypothetical protein
LKKRRVVSSLEDSFIHSRVIKHPSSYLFQPSIRRRFSVVSFLEVRKRRRERREEKRRRLIPI